METQGKGEIGDRKKENDLETVFNSFNKIVGLLDTIDKHDFMDYGGKDPRIMLNEELDKFKDPGKGKISLWI